MIRLHSTYSIKRGFGQPKDYILRAHELGMTHLAITEYGNDFSWPYFRTALNDLNHKEFKDNPIDLKFLYGVEFFITNDMTSKGRPNFDDINYDNDTIIFMAKNNKGYTQLLKILSEANLPQHYFMYPRIDFEYVSEISGEDLICIIPSDFSTISKLLVSDNERQARKLISLLKSTFDKEDIYFELPSNVSETHKMLSRKIIDFSNNVKIKTVASSNTHYPLKEDKKVHDVILAWGQKKSFAENDLYSIGSSDNFLKNESELITGMIENGIEEEIRNNSIKNIKEIFNKCEFELEIAPMALPNVDVILPDEYKGKPVEYFKAMIHKGWEELITPRIDSGEWDEIKKEDIPIYEKRRDYEFDMIKNIFTIKDPNHPMKDGFVDYFLIVSDYTKWAKGIERRIMKDAPIIEVGPARGSVSGSLIGYLTRMSTVDPIPWGLTFERFINPERVSWPDVDLDFDPNYAYLVEKYLIETYGEWHVAHILTYQTSAGKNSFENVSKVLSGKYGKYKELKADKLKSERELRNLLQLDKKSAREIQDLIWPDTPIKEQLNPDSDNFNELLYEKSQLSAYKQMFEIIKKTERIVTSTGSHPGACIITKEPLYYHTSRVNNGKYADSSPMLTTSYEKYALEEVNTMKFDILRLSELTIVKAARGFIKESLGEDVDLDRINPFDINSNIKMLKLMKDKDLDGVFQFSSNLYKNIIEEVLDGIGDRDDKEIARDLFTIIIALEALGRPGPLEGGMVPTFAAGLADPDSVEKIHEDVDKILSETFGNMLYQEQLMFILRQLGGFSLGQADMVRRGIASGKLEKIEEQRTPFLDGVKKVQLEKDKNTSNEEMEALLNLANGIFDLMTKWAGYGFNKAHSVGYGFLSLRGLYLKANYKPYFMAALMSANSSNEDKITKYIDEIRARGINVLPPKINKSLKGFTVVGDEILFGLEAIKGVGEKAVDKIISNYPYNNFADFVFKVGNRTILPPLIKAGYFNEDKKFLLKYWEVFIEIKEGKTKLEESIINYIEKNGINKDSQINIEKKLEEIIYQKSLKKRTEKTRNECLNLIHREEYTSIELLQMEKDVLGLYLSESPLDKFKDMILNYTYLNNDIKKAKVNDEFYLIGMILETPPKRIDKNKREMCFLKLQTYDGMLDIPIFADAYAKHKEKLIEGNIIIGKAKKIRGGITLNSVANLIEKYEVFKDFFLKNIGVK